MRSKIILSVLIYSSLAKCILADENVASTVNSRIGNGSIVGENIRTGYPPSEAMQSKQARQMSGIHFYPGSPVYDSLLTRRTFIPSFRMVLLELSLMTLGVFVMNAVENMMHAAPPKAKLPQPVRRPQPPKKRYRRMLYERHFSLL